MNAKKTEDVSSKPARSLVRQEDEAVAMEMARYGASRETSLFYRRMVLVLAPVLALSVLVNGFLALSGPRNHFFATDPAGRVWEMSLLDRPLQSQSLVLNWSVSAITQAFSISFATIDESMADARPFFTSSGWTSFREALEFQSVLQSIEQSRFVTSAVATAAPVVVAEGLINGSYGWKIEVPLMITYQSATEDMTQNVTATMVVTQVPRDQDQNGSGLGIINVVAK